MEEEKDYSEEDLQEEETELTKSVLKMAADFIAEQRPDLLAKEPEVETSEESSQNAVEANEKPQDGLKLIMNKRAAKAVLRVSDRKAAEENQNDSEDADSSLTNEEFLTAKKLELLNNYNKFLAKYRLELELAKKVLTEVENKFYSLHSLEVTDEVKNSLVAAYEQVSLARRNFVEAEKLESDYVNGTLSSLELENFLKKQEAKNLSSLRESLEKVFLNRKY